MPDSDAPSPSNSKPSASPYVSDLPLPEELQTVLGGAYVVESLLLHGTADRRAGGIIPSREFQRKMQ